MTSQPDTQSQQAYDFFVFGDSLSDTGNLYKATLNQVPPSPPYSNGRFSNGDLAVEILAKQLGIPFSLETNFAIGGARTDRTNTGDTDVLKFGGLLDEVDRFKTEAKQLGAGAEDLYLVWAGGNDFLKLLGTAENPVDVVNAAVANIVSSVKQIAKSGAKNIVVVQNPNVGRVPLSLQAGQLQNLTALGTVFNAALETAIGGLQQSLKKKNLILTNLFSLSENIAQNPATFGLTNVTTPLIQNPTADPNQFFFWDDVHPTTKGHSIFADALRTGVLNGITDNVDRVGTGAADRLVSFKGSDRLDGRGGADYLEGNGGKDVLLGRSGADTLLGGDGKDQLTAGGGKDVQTGGAGKDRFIYGSATDGGDTITDFEVSKDLIDLQGILRRPNYTQSNRFESYVELVQGVGGTQVNVDTNGDLAEGFQPLVFLSGVETTTLNSSSFRV